MNHKNWAPECLMRPLNIFYKKIKVLTKLYSWYEYSQLNYRFFLILHTGLQVSTSYPLTCEILYVSPKTKKKNQEIFKLKRNWKWGCSQTTHTHKNCFYNTASYLIHLISILKHYDTRETQSFPSFWSSLLWPVSKWHFHVNINPLLHNSKITFILLFRKLYLKIDPENKRTAADFNTKAGAAENEWRCRLQHPSQSGRGRDGETHH